MREMRVVISVMSALVAAVLCSSVFANNAVQHEFRESRYFPDVYIACLGETVDLQIDIYASYHEFVTPSGRRHVINNWEEIWMFTSLTGHAWYAKAQSPYQLNVGPEFGGTAQFVEVFIAKPLFGDGPKFKLHWNRKITENANGDLVVNFSKPGPDFSDQVQCIGNI